MKILIIRETELKELSPDVMAREGLAGTENSVVCLAQELSKTNEVYVCCPVPEKKKYGNVWYTPFRNHSELLILSAVLSPDVTIVAGNPAILFYGLLISKKLIFWQQNHPAELMGRFDIPRLLKDPRIEIVAPSPEAAVFYREFYSCQEKIHGIYNGIRQEFFEDQPTYCPSWGKLSEGRIVYCGSFTRAKGLSIVLGIAKELPEFHFRLCGSFALYGFTDEAYKKTCLDYSKDLQNVSFAGSLNAKDMANEMSFAELCIVNPIAGNGETCCVSALESMAVGTPVAAGSGIINPIIAHGGLSCSGPMDAWVDTVRSIMHNKVVRKKLGEQGKEFAKTLSWPEIAKQWINIFNKK